MSDAMLARALCAAALVFAVGCDGHDGTESYARYDRGCGVDALRISAGLHKGVASWSPSQATLRIAADRKSAVLAFESDGKDVEVKLALGPVKAVQGFLRTATYAGVGCPGAPGCPCASDGECDRGACDKARPEARCAAP